MTEQPTKFKSAIHQLEITLGQINDRLHIEDSIIEQNRQSINECEKEKSILRIQQKEISEAIAALKEREKI